MRTEQPLSTYRAKRHFGVTSEPKGARRLRRGGKAFVIQQHDATRMHWDFRLEIGGVMVSWAVPKGPSLDPADKRLAVQTEDHPIEYNSFEGVIPEGEYGGGPVIIWDRGTWMPEGDPEEGLRKGRLTFELDGEKLRGKFILTRTGRDKVGPKSSWLLIKRTDGHVRKGAAGQVAEALPLSVVSGLSVQEIGQVKPGRRKSSEPSRPKTAAPASGKPARRRGKTLRRFPPADLAVQLATLTDRPPSGGDWAYEIKFDGYRMLAVLDGSRIKLVSRNGNEWTSSFPGIVADLRKLKARRTVIDGEICYVTPEGKTDFQSLQNALDRGQRGAAAEQDRLYFHLFDVLVDGGEDVRDLGLVERKSRLQEFLGENPPARLQYSQHLEGNGSLALNQACAASLEGLIAKRMKAPYSPGRTTDWLKLKCHKRQEFIIVGMTAPAGSRQGFGSLLLAVREGGALVFKGKVGAGFSDQSLRDLNKRLRALESGKSPLAKPPRMRDVTWVKPELICEVEFTEFTSDGIVRHPSFQGLREDKAAKDITEEKAVPIAKAQKRARGKGKGKDTAAASNGRLEVAGVSFSHPDRVIDRTSGLTKGELAQYHDAIAPCLLPYAEGRPVAVVRCPQGDAHQCFFQKQKSPGLGDDVHKTRLAGHEVIYVENKTGLLQLVQFNVIEFHGWGAKVKDPERPDWIVMDLDPDTSLAFSDVVDAALELRKIFKQMKLETWVKTTGGKGLHVVIPVKPRADWDAVKGFAHGVADALAQQSPERYVSSMSKAKRKGKIFVDYLRNGEGATAVLPYSPRARPGATVAMPVEWADLKAIDPRQFTVRTAQDWIRRRRRDPWAGLLDCDQALPRLN